MGIIPERRRGLVRAARRRLNTVTPSRTDPRARKDYRRARTREVSPTDPSALTKEFRACWERGESPNVEAYIHRLGPNPAADDAVELIYLAYCLAEGDGHTALPNDLRARFPLWSEELSLLLELHKALPTSRLLIAAHESSDLDDIDDDDPLPVVGDVIGPYHLKRKLGEGSFARVFLAEQNDLDHRRVVVKFSTRTSSEPQLLARVTHPNVVEVLNLLEAKTEGATVYLVAMPFAGGATLLDVLNRARKRKKHPETGLDLLTDLDRVSAPEYHLGELPTESRSALEGLTYAEAIASLFAKLARALDNANRHKVSHGDIKPSNILLTAHAVPMLFDFNLAADDRVTVGGLGSSGSLGGTLNYMAPEVLRHVANSRDHEPAQPLFDRQRSDLYSLGLVLREALTGNGPTVFQREGHSAYDVAAMLAIHRSLAPVVAKSEAHLIPAGMRPILERCLATDPADRYRRAADLATDLERWSRGQATLNVPQAPFPARLKRSLTRSRPLIARWVVVLLLGCSAWGGSAFLTGQAQRDAGLQMLSGAWDSDTNEELHSAHNDRLWASTTLDDPGFRARRRLEAFGFRISNPQYWRDRPEVQSLPQSDLGDVEMWVLEQILRQAIAANAGISDHAAIRSALAWIEANQGIWRLDSLEDEAERLRKKLGIATVVTVDQPSVERGTPPGWLDHYLRGVALEADHAEQAREHYLHALEARPHSFWIHIRIAHVSARLKELADAVTHLQAARDLRPSHVATRVRLASCYYLLNRASEAYQEANAAVALDPRGEGLRLRSFAEAALGHPQEAVADARRYAENLASGRHVGFLKLHFAATEGQFSTTRLDPTQATQLAYSVLKDQPTDESTRRGLIRRLQLNGEYSLVNDHYASILQHNPNQLFVKYRHASHAFVYQREGEIKELNEVVHDSRYEELVRHQPQAIYALIYLARCYITENRLDRALPLAERALELATNLDGLRVAELLPSETETIGPIGYAHYTIAHILAASPDEKNESQLVQIANHLANAFALIPELQANPAQFFSDRAFDLIREQLDARLRGGL